MRSGCAVAQSFCDAVTRPDLLWVALASGAGDFISGRHFLLVLLRVLHL
jgi:hypothetical protein